MVRGRRPRARSPRSSPARRASGSAGSESTSTTISSSCGSRCRRPRRSGSRRSAPTLRGALEGALREWTPGERDFDVQARVAERLEQVGAFGACLIVGGDERVERFRHPLAAGEPMHRLVMAVVVAERHGLHAAATRFACAGGLGDGVRACAGGRAGGRGGRRSPRATRVRPTATCCARSTGRTPTRAIRAPGPSHYQGGPVGYRQREFEIVPDADRQPLVRHARSRPATRSPGIRASRAAARPRTRISSASDGLRRLTDTGAWPLEDGRPGRARHRDTGRRRGEGRRRARRACRRRGRRATTFPDGAHFRVEIPSVEGPHVLEEVVVAAEAAGIVVNRVSQGSGAMLLRESELRAMAEIGAGAGIEVSLFVGPREGFDIGAHARTAGRRRALRPAARPPRAALRGRGRRARGGVRDPRLPDRRPRPARAAHRDAGRRRAARRHRLEDLGDDGAVEPARAARARGARRVDGERAVGRDGRAAGASCARRRRCRSTSTSSRPTRSAASSAATSSAI